MLNDRAANRERARVRKEVDRWIEPLGLTGWRLHFEYSRSAPEERSEGETWVIARTRAHWAYREATVTFWLEITAQQDAAVLAETVVHEFMHVQVDEMQCSNENVLHSGVPMGSRSGYGLLDHRQGQLVRLPVAPVVGHPLHLHAGLELDQAVEDCLGARRTAGNVDVHRNDGVDAL